MREFETVFRDGLKVGLRRNFDNPRNTEALIDNYNVKCYKDGSRPFVPLNFIRGFDIDWPYPQVFSGGRFRVVTTRTEVYASENSWALPLQKTVSEGDRWDLIDYIDWQIMTNGVGLVTNLNGTFSSFTSSATIPLFKTGCNFKGQMIVGNIRSSWYGCGRNSVAWSGIGTADFTPYSGLSVVREAIQLEDLTDLQFEDGEQVLRETTIRRENVAGFGKMEWEGEVLRVMRLGNFAIVYGDNGITALAPHDNVYGRIEIMDKGIMNRNAVDGNVKTHLFVDKDNWVWMMGEDLKPLRLGYQEFMRGLNSAKIVVSYDKGKAEFYISDGTLCYLVTAFGMSRVYQLVSSVINLGGTSYGFFIDNGDSDVLIVTDTLDFGIREMKTISLMEIGIDCSAAVYAAVYYRYDKTAQNFTRSPWVLTGPEGVANIGVTAPEFRLCVKTSLQNTSLQLEDGSSIEFEDGTDISESGFGPNLDYMKVRVKLSDRRFIRGPSATDLNSNTESRRAVG